MKRRRFFSSQSNSNNYLTIEALEDGLSVKLSLSDILYCIDNDYENWLTLSAGTYTYGINKGHTLSFKGSVLLNISSSLGTFTISKNCNISGNCMSLLYGDYASENYSLSGMNYVFLRLFYNCTTIKNAHNLILPATILSESCYSHMFYGCTSLITAPELPAIRLTSSCYSSMFSGCTSLTQVPELPATTLASQCYMLMFSGCTSLTQVPELPATTLASQCYSHMFYGCTSLITAPELPAIRLADYCYEYMFYNCTSLTQAPELPAITLADFCYQFMFYNCTNLNYIKMLATRISAYNCLYLWVLRVAPTGTFVKNANMTSLPTGNSGIPSEWAVVDNYVNLITFIVAGYDDVYHAEEGMTWGDFINSEYNEENKFYTYDNNVVLYGMGGYALLCGIQIVHINDIIQKDYSYIRGSGGASD